MSAGSEAIAAPAIGERERSGRLITALLLAPSALWFFVLLILPLAVVLIYSVGVRAPAGGYQAAFTFDNYLNLPARWTAFKNTLTLAPLGTLICLCAGYPLSYFLAVKASARWRVMLLILVIVPFWTSFLIRTYAWIFILGGRGIPALLEAIGIPDVRLINTPFAVMCGIVYAYLPLMVFPIYVSLEKLDKRLLEASQDLGAGPFATFRQITLPVALPGLVTGTILVFIPMMGEYVIPQILGYGRTYLMGNALVTDFLEARNWPSGSARAVGLILIMFVTISLYLWFVNRGRRTREVSVL